MELKPRVQERGFGLLEGGSQGRMYHLEKEEVAGRVDAAYLERLGVESKISVESRLKHFLKEWFLKKEEKPLEVTSGRLFHVLCCMMDSFPVGAPLDHQQFMMLSYGYVDSGRLEGDIQVVGTCLRQPDHLRS
jgi:broad specificity phosphatase PhoE